MPLRNLATLWRDPALQKDKQTGRRQKDIQAEVQRGYQLARATIDRALAEHEHSWELRLALASFEHDENNYRHELGKDSGFSARREQAFESFQRAAELYEDGLEGLEQEKESTRVYELWFYAALGACDLGAIDSKMVLASHQIPLIQSALAGLPDERAERHVGMFASSLFSRMSNASPAVKYRYIRAGLEITGETVGPRERGQHADLATGEIAKRNRAAPGDRSQAARLEANGKAGAGRGRRDAGRAGLQLEVFGNAGPDQRVRAAQGAPGFAQRSARQHVAVAEPESGVDTHQVEVANQAVVLEAVVEHDDLGAKQGSGSITQCRAVATGQDWDPRRVSGQQDRLIAHVGGGHQHALAV